MHVKRAANFQHGPPNTISKGSPEMMEGSESGPARHANALGAERRTDPVQVVLYLCRVIIRNKRQPRRT